ncbi:MAG: permease [Nitrososphaerota archaeon]
MLGVVESLGRACGVEHDGECCHVCSRESKRWYEERLLLVALGLIALYAAHIVLDKFGASVLGSLLSSFHDYVGIIWLPMTVGLLVGGLIDRFVPREYVWRLLARHDKRSVIYSVGLGSLASACSHGILAISMELYRKGASTPAVIAFLLASPWASLPITILLLGLFGLKGLIFLISAIAIAVITGLLYQALDRAGLVECNAHHGNIGDNFSILADIRARWRGYDLSAGNVFKDLVGVLKGSWELTRMILWWIVIGMLIAAAIRAYVPGEILMNYMGPTLPGLLATLIFATVIEVCSEGTAPLALEIYRQTGAFGNALVFLMAGVATDYTEIGLIWSNIGKKAALWLPILTVPQIVFVGYFLNMIL